MLRSPGPAGSASTSGARSTSSAASSSGSVRPSSSRRWLPSATASRGGRSSSRARSRRVRDGRSTRSRAGHASRSAPRGLPRRRARLAARPGSRRLLFLLADDPHREPRERVLRGRLGLHRDGSNRPRGHRGARPLPPLLAPVLQLARGNGNHHPRRRRAAAAAGRRPSPPSIRARRPDRARAARRHDPRDGATAVGPLRRADRSGDRDTRVPRLGPGSTRR